MFVFVFYYYLERPLAGGVATLLLATLPAFLTYCRSSMSEITASTFVAGAFLFTYLGLKNERRWPIYTGAVLLGLAFNIRTQIAFFAPLVLAIGLLPSRTDRARWLAHCAGAILAFSLAASPTFILNTFQFKNLLKTGYEFWVPQLFEPHTLFSPRYIPKQLGMLWSHCALQRSDFNIAHVFGTGTYYVPAYVTLLIAGVAFVRFNRFTLWALFAVVVFFIATISYSFVDGRCYVPLLVVSVGLAALPVEWAMRSLRWSK